MTKNRAQCSILVFASTLLAIWCIQVQVKAEVLGHAHVPEIQDLLDAKGLHFQGVTATFSADGKWVASTVCDPARELPVELGEINRSSKEAARNSLGCDIWLYSVASSEKRNLTQGGGSNWSPSWSPDGELLAFHSDRDGRPKIWLWDRKSDDIRKVSDDVTTQQFGFETPLWLPDGRRLLVKLSPERDVDPKKIYHERNSYESLGADSVTVTVLVSPEPSRSPGGTSTESSSDEYSAVLAVVDTHTGGLERIATITDSLMQKLSPDGRYLAYLEPHADMGNVYNPYALVLLELATGMRREFVPMFEPGFPGALSWAPDSSKIAYISVDRESDGRNADMDSTSLRQSGGNLYIAPINGGAAKRVDGTLKNHFLTSQPPLWSEDGSQLYLIGADGQVWKVGTAGFRATQLTDDSQRVHIRLVGGATGNTIGSAFDVPFVYSITEHVHNHRSGIARIDLNTGASTQQLEEARFYGSEFESSVMSPDRRHVVFQAESSKQPPDLWISDLDFREPKRLSNLNPELDNLKLGGSHLIEFNSHDGERLQGAVLLPSNYRTGRRYPTVLWVYASDAEAARNVNHFGLFDQRSFNMQMLASRGYVVLWPNIPTKVGTPIDDLMKSVMPAIDKAVELGITDPDRLAVMGNSNGGYSTLALITRTRRFKAAVMNAGFGDLTAFHGTMGGIFIPWVEKMGGSMGVPPWEAPSRYVENSPIFKLDRIETPLIIQAGTEDKSIIQHSDQVWVEMRRLQKPAIYLRYGGEDHVLRGTANLQDYWGRVLDFFDKHLDVKMPPASVSTNP